MTPANQRNRPVLAAWHRESLARFGALAPLLVATTLASGHTLAAQGVQLALLGGYSTPEILVNPSGAGPASEAWVIERGVQFGLQLRVHNEAGWLVHGVLEAKPTRPAVVASAVDSVSTIRLYLGAGYQERVANSNFTWSADVALGVVRQSFNRLDDLLPPRFSSTDLGGRAAFTLALALGDLFSTVTELGVHPSIYSAEASTASGSRIHAPFSFSIGIQANLARR